MNATTAATVAIDPVCGMRIDTSKAVGSSSYEGETYHFCSRSCETKFDADPKRYVGPARSDAQPGSCCSAAHSCS